ncbi:MAG TPA: hypothetical protein VF533_07320 [Solirubrobacteraceae bacterium]
MPPRTRLVVALALAALAFIAPPASAAGRSVPHGWLGAQADGPMTGAGAAAFDGEWSLMAASGVENVRAAFYWSEAQPYRTLDEVPPDRRGAFRDVAGVPTDFAASDQVVAAAARRHLGVLPVVQRAPGWAREKPFDIASPPRDPATFAAFMRALVGRYGPQGSFWAERPELPRMVIHSWQIWNEPDLDLYWSRQPFQRSYVKVLRAAHRALHAADGRARTVLAGLPNESFKSLRRIYRAGGKGAFDVIGLHPYTGKPSNVVKLVKLARKEARRAKDAKRPIWVTELSWPAATGRAHGPPGFTTTDKGQATRLRQAIPRLARERKRLRIGRVYWYTWLSEARGPSAFDFSGLRRLSPDRSKVASAPALAAFQFSAEELQGCAKSPEDATRCR